MNVFRRLLLVVLEAAARRFGPLLDRLRAEREALALAALRARYGGFQDGAWVRVVAASCDNCAKDHPVGAQRRIKRFTTESRAEGEWVFDKPHTVFVCAPGVRLEALPFAESVYAALTAPKE